MSSMNHVYSFITKSFLYTHDRLNGSYEALKGGQSSEALEDFTGGMCLSVPMSNAPKNLFQLMLKSSKFKSLMCAAIDARSAAEVEAKMSNGLVKGHAYTISNIARVCILQSDLEKHMLIKRENYPSVAHCCF